VWDTSTRESIGRCGCSLPEKPRLVTRGRMVGEWSGVFATRRVTSSPSTSTDRPTNMRNSGNVDELFIVQLQGYVLPVARSHIRREEVGTLMDGPHAWSAFDLPHRLPQTTTFHTLDDPHSVGVFSPYRVFPPRQRDSTSTWRMRRWNSSEVTSVGE
jgi:hypothetical protein